jgi:hypothetical protein
LGGWSRGSSVRGLRISLKTPSRFGLLLAR